MENIFILRMHSRQVDEHFFIFRSGQLIALMNDRNLVEKIYKKNCDYSITVTKKELNFKLKQFYKF